MTGRLTILGSIAVFAALAVVMTAGAQQSYTDPGGDAGAGTDITGITVRNDQSGLISVQIASASPIVGNHAVALFIDADKNPATGDDGDEAWMYGGPLVGSAFFSCSSSGCAETNPATFRAGAAGPNVTEFQFHRSDLGGSSGFTFVALSLSIDPPSLNFWDIAPNSGSYSYDLVFPQCSNGRDDDGDGAVDDRDLGCSSPSDDNESDDPVNIRLGAPRTTPAAPRAGSIVTIAVPTTRVETGRPLDGGTVRCTASYPGKRLRASGSIVGGRATCKLRLPAAARGKKVRGVLTVTYRSVNASKPFTFRVN